MTFENVVDRFSPTLKRISYKLNGHFTYFDDDDLMQEAIWHLWFKFKEGELEGKTDSYVLQGCYFHLKNYIRKAMDKAKLLSLNAALDDEDVELEQRIAFSDPAFDEMDEASFVKELPVLKSLSAREKKIMLLSLEGMTVREIGMKLGISHVMVVKIKKMIKDKCGELKSKNWHGYQN